MNQKLTQYVKIFEREWNKRFKLTYEPKGNSQESYELSKKLKESAKGSPFEDSHRSEKSN